MATRLGDYERAVTLLQESHEAHRRSGNSLGLARGLTTLGLVEQGRGNLERAESLLNESLVLHRDAGDSWAVAQALTGLGRVAHARGDSRRAEVLYKESLALYRDLGHKVGITECLDDLANVAVALAKPRRAARLLGATEAIRSVIGVSPTPVQLAVRQGTIATVATELGDQGHASAWGEGQAMSVEQAIAYALEVPVQA